MESEDNVEVGSTFHKNLIRSESLQKELVEEDTATIRDYHDYVCYKRKRAAVIGVVVIVVVALTTFAIVYFTHIHPKSKEHQLPECDGSQTKFQPVEDKCFKYRDVQTREIMFKGHAEECMGQCLASQSCRSVDFYQGDGECWLFTVTSHEVLLEWSDKQQMSQLDTEQRRMLNNCMHYDRMCI